MQKVASFSLYGYTMEILSEKRWEFDLAVFSNGLDRYISDVRDILKKTTYAEANALAILDPEQQRDFLLRRAQELGVPESEVPTWLREIQWTNLQSLHLQSLTDQIGGLILHAAVDPWWPNVGLFASNVTVRPERITGRDVASRGSYTLNVEARDKGISETLTVPVNQYFERVYRNAILDIDSLAQAAAWAWQWAWKALFWLEMPELRPGAAVRDVQFSKSHHGFDPQHLVFNNAGDRAWSLEITMMSDRSMPLDIALRDAGDFTNKLADARLNLESGSQVFVIRGSYYGFPAPLPSFQMSLYPKGSSGMVKTVKIEPLDFWDSLARGYLF